LTEPIQLYTAEEIDLARAFEQHWAATAAGPRDDVTREMV
jgi:hypothetical protein